MFPKRGAVAIVVTALALVLLLSFKTPDAQPIAAGSVVSPATGSSGAAVVTTPTPTSRAGSGSGSTSAAPTPAPATGGSAKSAKSTVTGSLVQTRYGDVEVQVSVANGSITDVQAVALPSGGRSGQISRYVAPILASEALQVQSARIDIISGATYTSEAYAASLQSALDQAGIGAIQVNG
jgi:uncharacterized protein with FMN-binding domain